MDQKLFVLSMDAMVGEDLEYLKTRPNYKRIMEHCCRIGAVQTIYPSITYPAHASMITGCRVNKHGVYNNTKFPSDKNYPDWHLFTDKSFKVEDLFAAAKRAGCTTGAVYWPVMGNNKNIDYNINEYFFYDKPDDMNDGEKTVKAFMEMGASEETAEAIRDNLDRIPSEYRHRVGPIRLNHTFDHFINGCICSLIRRYQPDVLVAHNCILDTLRHRNGVFNDVVTWGLDMTDYWLGEIADAMAAAGVLEKTNFVIVSDHGQMNFSRRLKPNVLFARKGWLTVGSDGKPTADSKVISQSNGMSDSVYVTDKSLLKEVHEYLQKLASEEVWGFSEVFTTEEVDKMYGWSGPFDFVIETDGYTTYSDDCREPLIAPIDLSDYRLGKATHGYRPEKGPQPVFVAVGPAFKEDVTIPFAYTIDEAPTFAHILGQSLPNADGRVLTEILA
ncbi:MAG: alkaline phosphatase family protein [Spirochaetales bacterium]|nr:alkaline phosphatase family protein [Spirochaetales bacterium]